MNVQLPHLIRALYCYNATPEGPSPRGEAGRGGQEEANGTCDPPTPTDPQRDTAPTQVI